MNPVRLLVEFHPKSTLQLNEDAVVHLLRRLLGKQIAQNSFLTRCGIELGEGPELTASFDPVDTLRVNEDAVGWLLKRILDDEIAKSPFLASAGVHVEPEKGNPALRYSANS